jgi:hypothetical protein
MYFEAEIERRIVKWEYFVKVWNTGLHMVIKQEIHLWWGNTIQQWHIPTDVSGINKMSIFACVHVVFTIVDV